MEPGSLLARRESRFDNYFVCIHGFGYQSVGLCNAGHTVMFGVTTWSAIDHVVAA
jgi:hypothetical protein